jgi:hypothetical protein
MRAVPIAVLVLALASTGPSASAAPTTDALACCDHVNDPDSCSVVIDVHDLSFCDPAAELGVCVVAGEQVVECEPVQLYCCAESAGIGWLDTCEEFLPGTACAGVVLGKSSGMQ